MRLKANHDAIGNDQNCYLQHKDSTTSVTHFSSYVSILVHAQNKLCSLNLIHMSPKSKQLLLANHTLQEIRWSKSINPKPNSCGTTIKMGCTWCNKCKQILVVSTLAYSFVARLLRRKTSIFETNYIPFGIAQLGRCGNAVAH